MIVNLQETPHDGAAALVVRARVDAVMERLCAALGVDVPRGGAPAPAAAPPLAG